MNLLGPLTSLWMDGWMFVKAFEGPPHLQKFQTLNLPPSRLGRATVEVRVVKHGLDQVVLVERQAGPFPPGSAPKSLLTSSSP